MEDHIDPFLPEDDHHRNQRTDVKQDIQHLHGGRIRLDSQQDAGQEQMAAGGYGQEFTQALDETEQ